MNNRELLRKADIALSDLTSNGGLLTAEQGNAFIRKLILQPTMMAVIRVVEMNAPQRNINKIQFGSRILRAGTSATALSQADRSKPTTSQVQLNTDEVVAEVRLPYDVIEDNIERGNIGLNSDGSGGSGQPASGGFVDTIQTLMVEAASRDLEELAIQGDESSTDDYLALEDGYIADLTSNGNVVNVLGGTVARSMFKSGLQSLPPQYHRDRASMRNFLSVDNEIEYRDTLAARSTGLGDNTITGFNPVFGFGVPVQPVHLMPNDHGILTNPLNLIMGIQRQITLEYDKDISARVYKMVLSARVAVVVEEPEAAVVYNNIGGIDA
jgi:hypothetical protein